MLSPAIVLLGLALALDASRPATTHTGDTLKVATLNVAHGRAESFNQLFQRRETTRQNLLAIGDLLRSSRADVVALQEADAPSRWSGRMNHVDVIAEHAGYAHVEHGIHATNRLYQFGTAVLSQHPLHDALSHAFERSPPTTQKGFVRAFVHWNPGGRLAAPVAVQIISVHLDFSRQKVRDRQVAEMIEVLGVHPGPSVLMGDFNAEWADDESSIKDVAEQLELTPFAPERTDLGTYGKRTKKRLDWILITRDLAFDAHTVHDLRVSDHLLVTAVLRLTATP